jgi:hypothetical protein
MPEKSSLTMSLGPLLQLVAADPVGQPTVEGRRVEASGEGVRREVGRLLLDRYFDCLCIGARRATS